MKLKKKQPEKKISFLEKNYDICESSMRRF